MSVVRVSTPFNIELEFVVAAFHKRLLAWMIDLIIVLIYVLFMDRFVMSGSVMDAGLNRTVAILFIAIPVYTYHLFWEILLRGQSPGKRALGIRVMDANGQQAGISQYLIRWLFRLVDMVMTLGAGAVLSVALSKNSQRIGDMLAGTVVVDERAQILLEETIYLELEHEDYQPMFPEVMRLSDRDINGIRTLLDIRSNNKDTEQYIHNVADRIRQVLRIDTELSPQGLLEQLLRDYNFLTRH